MGHRGLLLSDQIGLGLIRCRTDGTTGGAARFDLWCQGSAGRDFLCVARETTLGGDQFSAVTGGIADRPAPGSLEVVDVVDISVGGHAEKDEVVQDRVRA